MKKLIVFLAFILLPVMARSQTSDKVLWVQDSLKQGFDFLAIHPNGNILGGNHAEIYELYGNDGKYKRYFGKVIGDNTISSFSVSKDGNYILCSDAETNIISYETGKSIKSFSFPSSASAFFPDSKRVLIGYPPNSDSTGFKIYNIETLKEQNFSCKEISWFDRITVSDDGNYFAVAGVYRTGYGTPSDKKYSRVILYNAQTMQRIKTLYELENNDLSIHSLRFSLDLKYLSFAKYGDLRIYSLENFNLVKLYNSNNRPLRGVREYCYLSNSTMAITSQDYNDSAWFEIDDFIQDKILYSTNEFGSYGSSCEVNPINNSLVITNTKYWHVALDLSKLVSVTDNGHQTEFNLTYLNGLLLIDNIFLSSSNLIIKVFNLQGQTVYSSQINPIQYNEKIQIPIVLNSGVYIVQIIDGNKEYSKQINVVN